MIFDTHGLPKDNGASDFADSARLAGLLVLFDHPLMQQDLLASYIVDGDQGVRYPYEDPTGNKSSNNPKNFTRDQLICLAAGLSHSGRKDLCVKLLRAAESRGNMAQNVEADVPGSTKHFPDGADPLTADNMNHLRICADEKPKLLGKTWLVVDILFNAVFTPLAEPNQLMAQCKIAGQGYVKFLRMTNRKLDKAIRAYWAGWRGEPALAEFLIQKFR